MLYKGYPFFFSKYIKNYNKMPTIPYLLDQKDKYKKA